MKKFVYIPEAIRRIFGIRFQAYQFGERKFRRMFPDVPLLGPDPKREGQLLANWSEYQSVFQAEFLKFEFERRNRRMSPAVEKLVISRPKTERGKRIMLCEMPNIP